MAITMEFGEYAAGYGVTFSVTEYSARWAIISEFRSRLWYAARRQGLTLSHASDEVLRHKRFREAPQPKAKVEVWRLFAEVATMQAMPEAELRELAGQCKLVRYARGELVIREDDTGNTLYLIVKGEALLTTADKRGMVREVGRLGHGEYLGLLQVMLGQPSTFTVQALTDLTLVTIPADAINRLLHRYPQLARDLGQSSEARRQSVPVIPHPPLLKLRIST